MTTTELLQIGANLGVAALFFYLREEAARLAAIEARLARLEQSLHVKD